MADYRPRDTLIYEEWVNLKAFAATVRRHLGDETTNELWQMTHETLKSTR